MKINWFKIDNNKILEFSHILLLLGQIFNLAVFLTYLKQGEWCKDCGLHFGGCYCNQCEKCKYKSCLCDLYLCDSDNIRFYICEWLELNLSKLQILNFIESEMKIAKHYDYPSQIIINNYLANLEKLVYEN